MNLPSDNQGFLVGVSVAGADGARILEDIKGDTGRILAAMLRGGGMRARGATVVPARRPMVTPARDTAGRFIAAAGSGAVSPGSRSAAVTPASSRTTAPAASRPVEAVAAAVASLAATQEAQRRQAKADSRALLRGKDGRFGAGAGGGNRSGLGSLAASLSGGVGQAADGLERVAPMLQALGEARGAAAAALNVVRPAGRTIGGILSRGGDREAGQSEPTGLLRRLWREIRGLRKEQKGGDKAPLGGVRGVAGAGGGGGGGMLAFLGRFLLPVLLPLFAGAAAAIAGWFTGGALYKWFTDLDIGGRIGKAWDTLTGYISEKWTAGMQVLSDTFEPAQKWLKSLGEWVMDLPGMRTAENVFDAAKEAAQPYVDKARDAVSNAVRGAQDAGQAAGGWAKTKMGRAWNSVKENLVDAAVGAGVDPGLVAKIAGYESQFKADAQPLKRDGTLMSSAHGLGQFVDGTWVDMVRKHGDKYGVAGASKMTREQALGLRGDVGLQSKMLAEYTKENMETGRRLGGANDDANVYALHNLGAGDGSKFLKALKANPNAKVSDVLSGKVISNNRSLYGDGSISLADAYGKMGTAMARSESFALDARALAGPRSLGAMAGLNSSLLAAPPALTMPSAQEVPPAPQDTTGVRLNSPAPAAAPSASPQMPAQDVPDRNLAHIVSGGLASAGFVHR